MQYILVYLCIGCFVVLWDFRKQAKVSLPWNKPRYVREKNRLVAILFVFLWPIALSRSLGIFGFLRNLRAGRIHIRGRKSTGAKLKLVAEQAKYQNIVDFLSRRAEEQEWLEFKLRPEGKQILIHDGQIYYDRTLEELGCPTGARHTLYSLGFEESPKGKIIWNIEEAHNPFGVGLSGHGSSDVYEEDTAGNIAHIKQTGSWIS